MSGQQDRKFIVQAGGQLTGSFRVPGDKSISHRSIMLGSLAEGVTEISGFLAGQSFDVTMSGDKSLSGRPMRRVTDPLALMGANIDSADGKPPLTIHGGHKLKAIEYDLPMASAQVKSCLLLAGMYAEGTTSVTEPAPTRDHTERMLQGMGYPVVVHGNRISIQGGGKLTATSIDVPGDISSATFFMVGAAIAPGSDITLQHVGINPTRTGVINILKQMGADISLSNEAVTGGEPVADIRVRYAPLSGIEIPQDQVPLAIDEFPAIFIAAACAEGRTVLTGAEELRVKESDRIQVMADGLQALGIDAQPTSDGMIIEGGIIGSGEVDGHGDHRIAMSFAMAALQAGGAIQINDCANVATSFPNFVELATHCGLQIDAFDV